MRIIFNREEKRLYVAHESCVKIYDCKKNKISTLEVGNKIQNNHLLQKLEYALESEDYEKAAQIRDLLNNGKNKEQ